MILPKSSTAHCNVPSRSSHVRSLKRNPSKKQAKGHNEKKFSRIRKKKNEGNKRNSKIGKRLTEQALGVSLETWQYVVRRETHQARGYSLGIVIRSLACPPVRREERWDTYG